MFRLKIRLTETERLLAQADERLRLLTLEIVKVNKVFERKKLRVLSFDKLHSEGADKAFIDLSKSEYTSLTPRASTYFIEANYLLTDLIIRLYEIAGELPEKHMELARVIIAEANRIYASLIYLTMNYGISFFSQPVEIVLLELGVMRATLFRIASILGVLKGEKTHILLE